MKNKTSDWFFALVAQQKNFFLLGVAAVLGLLIVYLVSKEYFYWSALPVLIIFALIVLYSYRSIFFLIPFLAPLSLQLRFFVEVENDLSLPLEPLLIGVLFITLYKFIFEPGSFNRQILKHPVSIAILINLSWLIITSFTSTMPWVSFKFTLSRMWFLASFFLMAAHLFSKKENAFKYFWLYIISFIVIIAYGTSRLNEYGLFNKQAANYSVVPLLPDHTSYGAILAMLIPLIIFFLIKKGYSGWQRIGIFVVFLIYIAGTVFSYTRAAWLSLGVSVVIFILLLLRLKLRTLVIIGAFTGIVLISLWDNIIMHLEKNTQDASDDLLEQLYSITNISTDASNLERINRWNCALRMFDERPVFGFGPGTYMFQYAPYQIYSEKTIISTNFGEVGNAHSEYLGYLSESGILGALTYLIILLTISSTAFRVYHYANDPEVRKLSIAIFLGLFTYFVHGFLNNFLDIDKFSLLFWGYAALLVSLDIFYVGNNSETGSLTTQSNHQ